ncbi:hypothetical protein RJ639_041752 [Escallonia herrerae]|uniref:F-box family protein n=1 Tax=Escallonia herrerae TaxID=1293975 RepID=A0AA88WFP4_9ASTE|nr:hypothetical protein RJ639_041752 [Escallonia herrerae]
MSDRIVQTYHDADGKTVQSMQSYQSAWMAHWTRTSCNVLPETDSHASPPFGYKQDDLNIKQQRLLSEVEIVSEVSRPRKIYREPEGSTINILDDNLTRSSKNARKEMLGGKPPPSVDLGRRSGTSSILKNDQDTSHPKAARLQIDQNCERSSSSPCPSGSSFPPATETSLRDCQFQPRGLFPNSAKLVKSHMFFGDSSFTLSRPLPDAFTGSASRIVEQEHTNHHSHSGFLAYENMYGDCSNFGKAATPYRRQSNTSLILKDSSTNNNLVGGGQYQIMQNKSGFGNFPSQSIPPEMTKSENLHHGRLLRRMPHPVHNSTRICTSVESVEELAGGPPGYAQATRSFLITKNTDVSLYKESHNLRDSRITTHLNETGFHELHSLSPLFGRSHHGVKLELLRSTDSEGRENGEDVKTPEVVPKNESSAETDIMDMDYFEDKTNHSDANSSPSHKDMAVDPNLSQAKVASAGGRRPIAVLPDINLELPLLPTTSSSTDGAEPSTSRTQSLDMEVALSTHAEQPSISIINQCPDEPLRPEPSSRWVKRLKLSASEPFAFGTMTSNLGQAWPHKPLRSSKLTSGKRHGKEPMPIDQTTVVLASDSSSLNTGKNDQEITLSHSWIQRWCHNRAATPEKKPEAALVCDPQSSKLAFEDFQKKQFPSVAAMALMGKAMTGFQPCEFRKTGSFIVWNTKGF